MQSVIWTNPGGGLQGPTLLKKFGGDKPDCLRFDYVNMFIQP